MMLMTLLFALPGKPRPQESLPNQPSKSRPESSYSHLFHLYDKNSQSMMPISTINGLIGISSGKYKPFAVQFKRPEFKPQ